MSVTKVKVNGGWEEVISIDDSVTIPSKTSDLTNDSGFITQEDLGSIERGTPVITATVGTVESGCVYVKYGKMVILHIRVSNDTEKTTGSNIFDGVVQSDLCPVETATGVGYYSHVCAPAYIRSNGQITVQCTGDASLAANAVIDVCFTYFTA